MSSLQRVRQIYDADPEREWARLEDAWLEHFVTGQFIRRYLQPGSIVLDIGSGPGRYAIELAVEGHGVDLVDLAPANVETARA